MSPLARMLSKNNFMKKSMIRFLYVSLLLFWGVILVSSCGEGSSNQREEAITERRIVSLDGAITEIVVTLGYGNELVGRDVTSTYPDWIKDSVTDLGHVRSLAIESLLELNPTLILASEKEMVPDLEDKIRRSGVEYKFFDREFSLEGTKTLIREVGAYFQNPDTSAVLQKIDKDISDVEKFETKPKVLFVYARGAGTLMVAGENTPMEGMIEMAGGENAVSGFQDFKPLTAEALISYDPEIILMFDSGAQSLGGEEGILLVPGVSETKAGKNKAIVTMDGGLLSGFGPRVGEAVVALNRLIDPYAE